MSPPHRICSLAVAVLAAAALAGCASSRAAGGGTAPAEPASVAAVGHDGLHRVTLTPDGAARIGLVTAAVRTAAPATGATTSVPTAAILYDDYGRTWVYQRVARLTFERARVVVVRTAGSVTMLSSGPAAGNVVATVGLAELRGAEDGVPGEQ